MHNEPEAEQATTPKRKFKRFHQETCGNARQEYDDYADVRDACDRKLKEWEHQGILVPWHSFRVNDWLFG